MSFGPGGAASPIDKGGPTMNSSHGTRSRRRLVSSRRAILLVALACSWVTIRPAAAQAIYGSLSNFDVINDTGKPCHGFEIELDGLSSTDVVYTFAAPPGAPPYIRYSTPEIVPIAAGVIVRYASPYDPTTGWAATTPPATSPYPVTMGHQCWYGGDPVNYPTSGCEHFGVSLIKNPTNTIYRWLVEGAPGTLTPVGSNVSIPAPAWKVVPQPPVPNLPPPPPVVVAVVEAPPPPPPEAVPQWGEAIWEKVYVTELPEPPALEDLLLGGAAVPNPDVEPPEVEWQILQSAPAGEPPGPNEIKENQKEVGAGKDAVSRRYEFYKYTGQYTTEHEALCEDPTIANPTCGSVVPAKTCSSTTTQVCVLDADCASPACPLCGPGETCVQHCSVTATHACATDADCSSAVPCLLCGLNETCQTNLCSPSNSQVCGSDADCASTAPCPACVAGEICGLAGVGDLIGAQNAAVNLVADQCHEAASCDPVTGVCTRPDKPNGTPCDDGDVCTQTDTCQAGVCVGANPVANGTPCDDGYVCTLNDTCQAGVCVSGALVADGTACDDGNACTQTDTCQAGLCVSGTPAADGAACDDGDACTQTDTCQAGVCTGANPVTCAATDQCHTAGTCNPATGTCSNPPAADGTACSDGNACTQTDTCQAGVCTGSNPSPSCGSADLSLKLQGEPRQVRVGREVEYRLRVKNFGPDAATAGTATLICSGVPYDIVDGSSGCVATGGSVTCPLETLMTGGPVTRDITIMPEAAGVLSCTGSVSSATPDPDLTNQSSTLNIRVR